MTSPILFPVSKRSISDLSPHQHYSTRIQQFSLLAETQEKYESSTFEIGGYNWRLRLYPKGNSKSFKFDKEHRISLYLAIQNEDSFPKLWEVFVQIKFFAFDHIHSKYAIFEDVSVRRYHGKKTEYGIQTKINGRNGYLVNDTCVLGAEVFVFSPSTIHESIYSVVPRDGPIALKLLIFPSMKCKPSFTEEFISVNYKWRLRFDHEDCGQTKMSLSLCLQLVDGPDLGPKDRVFANYELRVKISNKNYKVSKSFTTDDKLSTEKPRADACYVCDSSPLILDLTVEVEFLSILVSKLAGNREQVFISPLCSRLGSRAS